MNRILRNKLFYLADSFLLNPYSDWCYTKKMDSKKRKMV